MRTILCSLLATLAWLAPVQSEPGRTAAWSAGQVLAPKDEPPEREEDLSRLRAELEAALEERAAGQPEAARRRVAGAIDKALARLSADGSTELVSLCLELGRAAHDFGDLRAAERAQRAVLELHERTLPSDHGDIQRARGNLAQTLYGLGDLGEARALLGTALEASERTLPAGHPRLDWLRENLGVVLATIGDHGAALALYEAVLARYAETLPDDHPDVLRTRGNRAAMLRRLGDLEGARDEYGAVLEAVERAAEPDPEARRWARQGLAVALRGLGDLRGADALFEAVLAAAAQDLPDDHPNLQRARQNYAATRMELGDLARARVLLEAALASLEHTYPADHPELLYARSNLAGLLYELGDLRGARALQEQVLELLDRTLPTDHPDLQGARLNLAATLLGLGEEHAARHLDQAVLAALEATMPADHPELLRARLNLAGALKASGDLDAARALQEEVLQACTRTLPADHPDLLRVRYNLAATLADMGEESEALEHLEQVLAAREGSLPAGHPDLQRVRADLAVQLARVAMVAGAPSQEVDAQVVERSAALLHALVSEQLEFTREALLGGSAREAEERMARSAARLSDVFSFLLGLDAGAPREDLIEGAFALSEASRGAAPTLARLARTGQDATRYRELRAELTAASIELAQLLRRGAGSEEFHRSRARREAAERELLALARQDPAGDRAWPMIGSADLERVLGPDEALICFRRFQRTHLDLTEAAQGARAPRVMLRSTPAWLAFALTRPTPGDRVHLAVVDLGPGAPIERAVGDWRGAIGVGQIAQARGGARGIGLEQVEEGTGHEEGLALRRLVWDPLLPFVAHAGRAIVIADDVLHLVPFDALPLEESAQLLGDRWQVVTRLDAQGLLEADRPPDRSSVLVALGGAEFDRSTATMAGGDLELALAPHGGAARTPGSALRRGGPWEAGFAHLAHTGREARELASLFERVSGSEGAGIVLEGVHASREALQELAPGARWLHVATHGWFASESIRTWADPSGSVPPDRASLRANVDEVVRGMSPMLLCGLALAGGNLPPDDMGRASGLVTAEELSGFDLANCELAVLSACDTNVGERRAGQGVASLQKALHMAGARSAITSLWKVPDEATAELMLDFYRRLWVEGEPKAQALWGAKQRLRAAVDDQGRPLYGTRDWAAWVLSGQAD